MRCHGHRPGYWSAVSDVVEVWFRFVPRQSWLPYDTEAVPGVPAGPDTVRITRPPFLQEHLAEGDVVQVTAHPDGTRWATRRVSASGNCTVRVLPVPGGPLGRSAAAVRERLAPFGLGGAVYSEEFPLVAVTVPAEADLAAIKKTLGHGEAEGWWHVEAACVTDAWRGA